MAARTARSGKMGSVSIYSIYFVALLCLGVCGWLGLADLRVHRALALAKRQSDRLSATVQNQGNEVRQLQALVVDLSNATHHNLTHLRAVTDRLQLQLHHLHSEHASVGTQRGDDRMDDDKLFAVFDSKAVQSKKTAGGNDGDKAPTRKHLEDKEEEHAGGKAAADTAAGATRNVTCAKFSSSPCFWGARQHSCTTVPGTLLTTQNAAPPLESCLGGHFSWGTCQRGKFLCRSDMERNISGCRVPQFAMQGCVVSQSNKFIFIHVPKAAGSSIIAFFRHALCPSSAANSKNCKETAERAKGCKEAIRLVEECNEAALMMMPCDHALAKYPSFFRFSFVRNPFTRAVSAFLMASSPEFMQDGKLLTFEEWARDPELLNTHLYALHWMPATDFLYTELRCRVPDFVGKQETLEADLRAALKRIGNKDILEHLDVHGMPYVNKAFQNGSLTAKFLISQYCQYVAN